MRQLTPYFEDLIHLKWTKFTEREMSEKQTSSQAVVHAIVRACANGKLPAIKESLNRLDGKLEEQIEVVYPKFYMTYPTATARLRGGPPSSQRALAPPPKTSAPPETSATGSLRDTVHKMSDSPQYIVTKILDASREIDQHMNDDVPPPATIDPLVKSVIVAGLFKMAHKGSLGAIFEVFDNLDGKLVDKIKILGEDVYLTSYDTIAPQNAIKNEDGIYQVEADNTTSSWAVSLKHKE